MSRWSSDALRRARWHRFGRMLRQARIDGKLGCVDGAVYGDGRFGGIVMDQEVVPSLRDCRRMAAEGAPVAGERSALTAML